MHEFWTGSSRGLATLLTPSGHEPFLEVRPHDRLSEAFEVLTKRFSESIEEWGTIAKKKTQRQ